MQNHKTGTYLRIGISGSYGGLNLGDEAILEGILAQIRRDLEAEISVFTRDPDDTLSRHGVDHAPVIRELTREEAKRHVQQLNLLILGGGGILYDEHAEQYLREVDLAHEAGVPVMVYAVSAGPLKVQSVRDSLRESLNRSAVITVRDRQGKHLLEEIGVEREIVITADPALLLEAEPLPSGALEREGLDGRSRLVGFSVREPGPAAPDIDVEHYHALLANAADFVIERLDADIVFVPMERKIMDVQHSHAVVSQMQNAQRATVLKGEYTPRQLISLIDRFELAVGMRLHFLIFAALSGVPFVALPYASKVTGLIEDLEFEMPPLDEVNVGHLIARIDRTWDYRKKIHRQIEGLMPSLKDRARNTHQHLLKLISSLTSDVNIS